MKFEQFEDMKIRQNAISLIPTIYTLTNKHPFQKDFGLRDQIRRAVNSISSNIVDGFERQNNNEFIRFLKIAKGSCGEVRNHLHIAYMIQYIDDKEFEPLKNTSLSLSRQLSGFIKYLEKNRRGGNFTTK